MSTPIGRNESTMQAQPPEPALRQSIETLRAGLQQLPQADYGAIVCHGGGMFSRTVFLKAGQLLVGRIHCAEHLNIMSSGDISVATEDGEQRLRGFHIMACRPGTRRVGLVHADTVWTTIIRTEETELERIEQLYFAPSHEALDEVQAHINGRTAQQAIPQQPQQQENPWPLSTPSSPPSQ